jgi:flagellin
MPTPLAISTNMGSITAQKNISRNATDLHKSISRLSSGLRLNSSADDAAGMAVSTGLRAQLKGYSQAIRNANDGTAILQTAEGAYNTIADNLMRMRELAVQAASDGLTNKERAYIQTEFSDIQSDIDRVSNVTEYNGIKLLDGSSGASGLMTFQVGTRNTANDNAIDFLSTERTQIGSKLNKLSNAVTNLGNTFENLSQANSQIRDVDMAQESAAFASSQVLQQAGVSMLAQANQMPNLALRLIG